MRKLSLALLAAVALCGCNSLTPAQTAALVSAGATTGAAIGSAIRPSAATQINGVGAAVTGGANAAAVILTPQSRSTSR